jgi:triose/dihydroxyacetone kinase / FAD-AMP lyase (cyclizing)
MMAHLAGEFAPSLDGGQYVALLNNLGGTTGLEMSILANALWNSSIGAAISQFIGPASMMTARDMHGFSLTLYLLEDI